MQIKTVRATNLAQLMESIRKAFGPEAVLLSVRRIDEHVRNGGALGIEGTVAIEGKTPAAVEKIEVEAPSTRRKVPAPAFSQDSSDLTTIEAVELIGPMGAGKTTTAAKIAGSMARSRSVPVGVISTDVERPGGSALLTAFAQELQLNMTTAATASDLQNRLSRWNCRGPLVIDTRGHSPRDSFAIENLGELLEVVKMKKQTYLVLSATEHPAVARECLSAYGQLALTGVILTRVDQAAGIGHCLDEVRKSGIPIAFIGTGERVPQDLHIPGAESLAALESSPRSALV